MQYSVYFRLCNRLSAMNLLTCSIANMRAICHGLKSRQVCVVIYKYNCCDAFLSAQFIHLAQVFFTTFVSDINVVTVYNFGSQPPVAQRGLRLHHKPVTT